MAKLSKQERRSRKLARTSEPDACPATENQDAQVEAKVISLGKTSIVSSREITSRAMDPFTSYYSADDLIEPYFNPAGLCEMLRNCDVMSQCVSAMQDNIDGKGWHFEYVPPSEEPDKEPDEQDKADFRRLERLFKNPNWRDTWVNLKQKRRTDKCLTGGSFMEIVRNIGDEIAEFHHIPAKTMRITRPDKETTQHVQWIREGDEWIQVVRYTRFRRFCQVVAGEKVWFKEFGDPRSLNMKTGKYAGDDENGDPGRWSLDLEASEISHDVYYSPNTIYGEPPWLSEILNIMGSSEAKKVNFLFFKEKTIPPFVIMVSGGTLGDKAVEKLRDYLEQEFKGTDNFHKILLLEAQPIMSGMVGDEKPSPVKIEIKPLTEFIQQDALFQNYIKNNSTAIRCSFKLPPVLIGQAEEYSHAAVRVALIVAEQQVFQPQRSVDDGEINRRILTDMGIYNWQMVSHGVPTTDDATRIEAMAKMPDATIMGHAVEFMSELMDKEPPKLDTEIYNMTIGEIRAKRTSALQLLMPSDDADNEDVDDDDTGKSVEKGIVKRLKSIRTFIKQLSKRVT